MEKEWTEEEMEREVEKLERESSKDKDILSLEEVIKMMTEGGY